MTNSYFLPPTSYPLLVIVGPTSSGKSELAVKLAKRFNGEIISADSRQIYRGMDLGTGKIEGKWMQSPLLPLPSGRLKGGVDREARRGGKLFVYKSIPHHLIDFVNPKRQYSAALFLRDAKKIIADIIARGKLPILCGGTAQWIDAVVYNQQIPDVKPNLKLRIKLNKKSVANLYQQLKKLDPRRAKNIDRHNKRRLIRALEIIISTGKPVPALVSIPASEPGSSLKQNSGSRIFLTALKNSGMTHYDVQWIGINPPQPILFSKIKTRLSQRLNAGMVKEVSRLHSQGLSWRRLESFGLEYKFVSLFLQKKISYDEMFEQLFTAIKQYSKRQMTWWKKNKDISWTAAPNQGLNLAKKFLK